MVSLVVDSYFFFLRVIFYQFEPAGNGSDNTFSIQDVTSGLVEKISKNRHNRLYHFTEVLFSMWQNVEIKENFK